MTTCLGKSCSFGLVCLSFVNVYQFSVCPSFPFGFEGGMLDLIALIPDHCLSTLFNPIALRKAKIVYIFCLSECNRVKVIVQQSICILAA